MIAPVTRYPIGVLAQKLSAIFGKPVHVKLVRRRVKAGMHFYVDAVTGRKAFDLAEVMEFWFRKKATDAEALKNEKAS